MTGPEQDVRFPGEQIWSLANVEFVVGSKDRRGGKIWLRLGRGGVVGSVRNGGKLMCVRIGHEVPDWMGETRAARGMVADASQNQSWVWGYGYWGWVWVGKVGGKAKGRRELRQKSFLLRRTTNIYLYAFRRCRLCASGRIKADGRCCS